MAREYTQAEVAGYEVCADPASGATNPKCAIIIDLDRFMDKWGSHIHNWTDQARLKSREKIFPQFLCKYKEYEPQRRTLLH
jgi:hypothetical protein